MSLDPLADRIESIDHASQMARYNVVERSTEKALQYAAEQPKLVMPLLQAIGVGQNVDLMV